MPGIDESRQFIPLRIAVLTVSDTRDIAGDKSGGILVARLERAGHALAADFLQAGAAGDNAAQTMGMAGMLRDAKRHEDLKFANTPTDLVKRAFLLTMDPELTQAKMEAILSRNALVMFRAVDPEDRKKVLAAGKKMNSQMARQGNSLDATIDILLQAFDPKGDGDDATGYREKVQIPGGPAIGDVQQEQFGLKPRGQPGDVGDEGVIGRTVLQRD